MLHVFKAKLGDGLLKGGEVAVVNVLDVAADAASDVMVVMRVVMLGALFGGMIHLVAKEAFVQVNFLNKIFFFKLCDGSENGGNVTSLFHLGVNFQYR